MRRRLQAFLPVVILAVLVQTLAPVFALRTAVAAAADPLAFAEICSHANSASDAGSAPEGEPSHDGCCPFCVAGFGAPMLLNPPEQAFVVLHREYRGVTWLKPLEATPATPYRAAARPRGPPAFS